MRRRYIAAGICLAMMVLLFGGCEKKEDSKTKKEKTQEVHIGITFDTFVLERWVRERDIFVATAEKMGANVDVQTANGDVQKQKDQMNHFIADNVDVIVVLPVDCFQLSEEVAAARERGIQVISYDRLIQGCVTDLYVTVDNIMVGELMAETMQLALPEGGNVAMLCGPEKDTNSADVVEGFEAGILDSNLKVVKKVNVKSWAPENGFAAVNEMFSEVQQIDAIMCGNDGLAGYAIKALSEKGLSGKVVVVGQDADLEGCQRVAEGTQTMTVYKPVERLAKIAAQCAVKMAEGQTLEEQGNKGILVKKTQDGEKVPCWTLPPTAVTKDNMEEVIIESGFHLYDEVYMNIEE